MSLPNLFLKLHSPPSHTTTSHVAPKHQEPPNLLQAKQGDGGCQRPTSTRAVKMHLKDPMKMAKKTHKLPKPPGEAEMLIVKCSFQKALLNTVMFVITAVHRSTNWDCSLYCAGCCTFLKQESFCPRKACSHTKYRE